MPKIHQLSETLVSQIKAGEVLERPASAVKELMENAIDSGAKSVKVSIEKGGLSLVKVEDDGEGIEPEDLPLAFARHATSKIRTFEDLYTATTMGFRGEALASLAAVARARIVSAREGAEAFEIEAQNGEVGPSKPSTRQRGTTVEARDLFFYVPARRKFLRSEATESQHCREAFSRAAMSRPDLAMSFFKDGKPLLRLPAQTPLERARALLGPTLSGLVAEVSAAIGAYSISGFAAPVGALPSGRETQMLFVNRRFANDKLLKHAAKEALAQSRGLGREREVAFVLFFELPTELVDANAHPAKTEVRFKEPREAHQFVYKALSEALAKLPAPEPDAANWDGRGRPLAALAREPEQDLFGESDGGSEPGSPAAPMDVANEAERFLGPLRGGDCAWDAGSGLWLAPMGSLAMAPRILALAELASEGQLVGVDLLIPAHASGLAERRALLDARSSQLGALGIDIEWLDDEPGSCLVCCAPDGFDNCDWSASLDALAQAFAEGKTDAVALCSALARGLDFPALGRDELWEAARAWMGARRLARELPSARFLPMPPA